MCACASGALLVLGRPVLRQPCVRVRTTVWVCRCVCVGGLCMCMFVWGGKKETPGKSSKPSLTNRLRRDGTYTPSADCTGRFCLLFLALYFYYYLLFSVQAKTGFNIKYINHKKQYLLKYESNCLISHNKNHFFQLHRRCSGFSFSPCKQKKSWLSSRA